jgi:hypothetical protein
MSTNWLTPRPKGSALISLTTRPLNATELAVTRERLDTVERLLEDGVPVTKANIDSYRPDDDAAQERQQWHADFISRILRIVHQELEAIENESLNEDSEKLADKYAAA